MTINLWELRSYVSWKDAASSTEEIAWSRVNCLLHLMNEIRFIKKSRRKSEHLNKNTSTSFCFIFFLFSLHFCFLTNFKTVRCIVKSLIAIQHIFVEALLKKENTNFFFWAPEFGYPNRYTGLPNSLDTSRQNLIRILRGIFLLYILQTLLGMHFASCFKYFITNNVLQKCSVL